MLMIGKSYLIHLLLAHCSCILQVIYEYACHQVQIEWEMSADFEIDATWHICTAICIFK